jgi:hypothetical protein
MAFTFVSFGSIERMKIDTCTAKSSKQQLDCKNRKSINAQPDVVEQRYCSLCGVHDQHGETMMLWEIRGLYPYRNPSAHTFRYKKSAITVGYRLSGQSATSRA